MNEREMKTRVFEKGELVLPPFAINAVQDEPPFGTDAVIEVDTGGKKHGFLAEFKPNAKPLTLQMAIPQVRQLAAADDAGRQPLLVVPYLDETKLEQLHAEGISGLDLCGNGVLIVPGELHVYRSGKPNRFKEEPGTRVAYRGDTSLVARALLLQPGGVFNAVGEIGSFIEQRGVKLAAATVSRALARLEEDLIIERVPIAGKRSFSIHLVDAERLLDQLVRHYVPPRIIDRRVEKVAMTAKPLIKQLEGWNKEGEIQLVRTGASSAHAYAGGEEGAVLSCCCRPDPRRVLGGLRSKRGKQFIEVELLQTDDIRVYFDTRTQLAASPVQSYLELTSEGTASDIATKLRMLLLGGDQVESSAESRRPRGRKLRL